jgi:hypothetical protein
MKLIKSLSALVCIVSLVAGSTQAAEKASDKKAGTCCEQAKAAGGKECSHKCCAAAHRDGKSCQKCNPNKEDLKKEDKKVADKSAK